MAELTQTWEELRAGLHRYVSSKVKVDVAEDIVHDILLRVLQNEDKLIAAEHPIAWVYTVAKNRIADYYRNTSKSSHSNVNVEEFSAETEDISNDIDNHFAKCLRPLANRLDAKHKEALLLTDFDELKQTDVAKQLGISLSGMKSRVQRARIKLKNELLDCCAVEIDRFGKVIDYEQKSGCNDNGCC